MTTPKYKKQYIEMIEKNKDLFESLKKYIPSSVEFKEVQSKVLRIIRKNEDKLCSKTENTQYSSYSVGLADKFMEEVRVNYPEIDFI
jgi:hypothetical protein